MKRERKAGQSMLDREQDISIVSREMTLQPRSIPRTAIRRGEITTLTAVAVVSALVTFYGTFKSAQDLGVAVKTWDEFATQRQVIAEDCRKLMELKLSRMHQRGEISKADFELAVEKVNAPFNDRVVEDVVRQLEQRQGEIAGEKFFEFGVNYIVNLGFHGLGNTIKGDKILSETIRNYLGASNNFASMGLSGLQAGLGGDSGPMVTPAEFLAALEAAENRLQGIDEDSESREAVRIRVRQFYDRWEMSHVDPLTERQITQQRDELREACHAAFATFLVDSLQADGWVIKPEGLEAFAWGALRSYQPYRRMFGVEERRYQLEHFDPNKKPLRDKAGNPLTLRYATELDELTGKSEHSFVLVLPDSVPLEDLGKLGLPKSREIPFDMELEEESLAVMRLSNQGREAKWIGNVVARVIYDLSVAVVALTRGERIEEIGGSVESSQERLVIQTNPKTPAEFIVEFRCQLLVKLPNAQGQIESAEKPFQLKLRAIPLTDP